MSDTVKGFAEMPTEPALPQSDPPPPPAVDDSLVPDKYKRDDGSVDYQAILVRHNQLEQQLGSQPPPAEPPASEGGDKDLLKPDELGPYVHEFANTGQLSEASYKALEDRGLSREMVNSTVQGEKAKMESYWNSVAEAAGGRDQYNQAVKWAEANLTQDLQDYYSKQLNSFDPAAGAAAIKALVAQAGSAVAGPLGGLVSPNPMGGGDGVVPFHNTEEVRAAMRVPDGNGGLKYETDPAYRREVDQRNIAMRKREQGR